MRILSNQTAVNLSHGLPPLSLYIHVPWCIRKCPYCDFNSHGLVSFNREVMRIQSEPSSHQVPESAYIQALQYDLEQTLPMIWGRPIHTVFFGGGTPSLLSAEAIEQILSMLRSHTALVPDAEITLEANPGTAEAARFRDYARAGINRLSLGIQSFDDEQLQVIGRVHHAQQAHDAIQIAKDYFQRINLDLMFGLPNQTMQACLQDVEQALSYKTEHLSLYQFTLEPNTYFAKYPPNHLPDEECLADMQESIQNLLAQSGFDRYEVSAYAKGSHARCQHNMNYWSFGDYVGIGPGAHGKISFPDHIMRTVKVSHPDRWLAACQRQDGSHIGQSYQLDPEQLPFEFMLNALRLREGVPSRLFSDYAGLPTHFLSKAWDRAIAKGLMCDDPLKFVCTPLGWQFLSDTQSLFLV